MPMEKWNILGTGGVNAVRSALWGRWLADLRRNVITEFSNKRKYDIVANFDGYLLKFELFGNPRKKKLLKGTFFCAVAKQIEFGAVL